MINWSIAEPICNKCENMIKIFHTDGFFKGVLKDKACVEQSSYGDI